MAAEQMTKQLLRRIDEGVAMEQNVLRMLDSMIQTTRDPEILRALEQHKQTTRKHVERLKERLKMHGSSPSRTRQATGIVGARVKGVVDVARRDKAGRNARNGFVGEQLEVASYQLLERIARRAGDQETAEVARQNRAEDEEMAKRLADNWDKFAELSLQAGRSGDGVGVRQRVAQVAAKLRQSPLAMGGGAIAAGYLSARRLQGGSGAQQQPERASQRAAQEPLETLTKKELQQRAAAHGIDVQRSMTKQQLMQALKGEPAPNASPFEVQEFLKGVGYPTIKDQLVREAVKQGADERIRATLERLPRRRFSTPAEVSEAIGEVS